MRIAKSILFCLVGAFAGLSPSNADDTGSLTAALPDDLTHLSLEQLLDIQVTSVSRVSEEISGAPAAIEVISARDIRHSGATSLPQLLRMVPGLQVAQINGRSWAIASRGFNASTSDKLEVRLDGRSLYTPLFSGVLWELQNPPLEAIDRIEIIRGPGASIWGSNAMNGVINIVTKPAGDTLGSVLQARAGDALHQQVYARQGADLGASGQWRAYVQTRHSGATTLADQAAWRDDLEVSSAGVRGDIALSPSDDLMLSIDAQDARMGSGSTLPGEEETQRNVAALLRFTRQLGATSDLQLQASVEKYWRDIPGFFGEERDTLDMDFRHLFTRGRHEFVWGLSFRSSADIIQNGALVVFDPRRATLETYTLFLQDRLTLTEDLQLTLGSKLENNDYTNLEVQPSARLSWQPSSRQTLWTAVSRAARAPNRVDRDLAFTTPTPLVTNDSFEAETALFAETGWRQLLSDDLGLDAAVFYADYDKLRGVTLQDDGSQVVANNGSGRSFGGEVKLSWTPMQNLILVLGYSYLNLEYSAKPGTNDINIDANNETDPEHQFLLRADWQINPDWRAFGLLRRVDTLPDRMTPAYNALDLHFSTELVAGLQAHFGGRNLLDKAHPEFSAPGTAEIERQVYAGLRWSLP